jgi:small GTP-binding protein
MLREHKVILVGDSCVGKTCIVTRAAQGTFSLGLKPTVGAGTFTVPVTTKEGAQVTLKVWDTAGQEKYETFVPMYARNAVGAVVVYDITSTPSFDHVPKWMDLIHADTSNCEIVLVGNKADLAGERTVSIDAGVDLADQYHIQYLEVSAQTGQEIGSIFETIAGLLVKFPKPPPEGEEYAFEEPVQQPSGSGVDLTARERPAESTGMLGWVTGLLRCSI